MYSVPIMWHPELREDSEIIAIIKVAKRKEQKAKEKWLEDGNRRESIRNRQDQSPRKISEGKTRMDFKMKDWLLHESAL